jgi:hypothetical protein
LEIGQDSAAKPTTNTWTISSDERIKNNIVEANLDICYSTLKAIPLKYYEWNPSIYSDDVTKDRHALGFIAQDVYKVLPKAVDILPLKEFTKESTFILFESTATEETFISTINDEVPFESTFTISIVSTIEKHKQSTIITASFENFMSLNVDQILKMNVGATQKLMQKIGDLEASHSTLSGQLFEVQSQVSRLMAPPPV